MINAIELIRLWVERVRLTPDLSTRVCVIGISFCCVISSGVLGYVYAKVKSANEQVYFIGLKQFKPWTKEELSYARGDISTLGDMSAKEFVASYGGKVFYHKGCKGVSRIKEENRIWFSAAAVAEMSGYVPAKNCTW